MRGLQNLVGELGLVLEFSYRVHEPLQNCMGEVVPLECAHLWLRVPDPELRNEGVHMEMPGTRQVQGHLVLWLHQ